MMMPTMMTKMRLVRRMNMQETLQTLQTDLVLTFFLASGSTLRSRPASICLGLCWYKGASLAGLRRERSLIRDAGGILVQKSSGGENVDILKDQTRELYLERILADHFIAMNSNKP